MSITLEVGPRLHEVLLVVGGMVIVAFLIREWWIVSSVRRG